MEGETLENFVTISVEGPAVDSYDLNRAVHLWKGRKRGEFSSSRAS